MRCLRNGSPVPKNLELLHRNRTVLAKPLSIASYQKMPCTCSSSLPTSSTLALYFNLATFFSLWARTEAGRQAGIASHHRPCCPPHSSEKNVPSCTAGRCFSSLTRCPLLLLVLRNKSYRHISFHKHHVGISPASHGPGSTLHGESGPSSVLPL